MNQLSYNKSKIFLPMPVMPVIEDVGWWQGEDGSAHGEPYRNAFPRPHCLADYQALVRLADRLGIRIALGMVLCEWDRSNYLGSVPGATWMGRDWDNSRNQGPLLDETAEYLRDHSDRLELGLHALCHEFWSEGRMDRSEFHDQQCIMRSKQLIRSHLQAFGVILEQNGFSDYPRLFLPPALHHSFGNGQQSMQAILHEYGIRYVSTRFSRARQFAPPFHEKITWESGVGLLERGLSPVPWHAVASTPAWDFSGPVLPLHWGNLLHPDPAVSSDIVDGWAELLLTGTSGPERILAADVAVCWRQAAVFYLAKLFIDDGYAVIDPGGLPKGLPGMAGPFFLTVQGGILNSIAVQGAKVVSERFDGKTLRTLQLLPEKGSKAIRLSLG